jgi:hypothetical protein
MVITQHEFVDAQQVDAPVAGDGLGELPVIGGFDELVGGLGGQGVADPGRPPPR